MERKKEKNWDCRKKDEEGKENSAQRGEKAGIRVI